MFKRNLAITATLLFAATSAPVFADDAIGSAVDGILNPSGTEVVQTAQGVGIALGYDVWYVQGSNARVVTPALAEMPRTPAIEQPRPTDDAYAAPAFGFQQNGA